MIREFEIKDLDVIMKIWLDSNMEVHDFIKGSYWTDNYEMVKNMLPDATIFVYEDNNIIQGFIGLMNNYIAGIFINANSRSQGIGKSLIDYVKKGYPELSLQVYKKNIRGVKFYLRENFIITKEQVDESTGEVELVMKWTK
ncbi:N-acetyltransferase [Clostridium sp. Marseille-P299]|uniref:N-acetyltransferase n=1 Tax=Clostridium sp. Marseille-P299 TaxID=1805477 RepID=UPI000829BDB9|nr:N-acetyltransferase [Clostridium sp. Marseille-P299]